MDVKEAVRAAMGAVHDLFGDQLRSHPLLEEFEVDDANGVWLITIGFLRQPQLSLDEMAHGRGIGLGLLDVPRQTYKVVRIDGGTGKVVSVKDRELYS